MTREEAIEFIAQSVKSDVDMAKVADAIKALEQEPTTKNDLPHCQHTDEEIAESFIEDVEAVKDQLPITKNDLGVDAISRTEVLKLIYDYKENHSENRKEYPINYGTLIDMIRWVRALPSVTPQLSSELEKNSQKLEKDFGELDCISRADVKVKKIYSHERHEYIVPIAEIDWLPSVIPQEPRIDFEELKCKILMEVDGGTDDKWLRYADVCDRISNSIDEYKAESEG